MTDICKPDLVFWNDLLKRIRGGKVIPVVGPGAVTLDPDDRPLYPDVLPRVTTALGIADPKMPPPTELSHLLRALRRSGLQGEDFDLKREELFLRLDEELKNAQLAPGNTLRLLARITHLRVYLTTTCDPMLAVALDRERLGRQITPADSVLSQCDLSEDLSETVENLKRPAVYHLLGRVDSSGNFAMWEDEALEHIRKLDARLPTLTNLRNSLKDSNLLFLGLGFPDWLLRFLVHVVNDKPISRLAGNLLYLFEAIENAERQKYTAFFDPLTKRLRVVESDPISFVAELHRQWAILPSPQRQVAASATTSAEPHHVRPGCIFLSYASPDRKIAEHLARQIEDAGGFVWFDRDQLKAGNRWEEALKDAVMNKCGLFLSIISSNTEKKIEGYYIAERNWASKRSDHFAQRANFYIPIRIDQGILVPENEPFYAAGFQAELVLNGDLSAELLARILALQRTYCEKQNLPPP